jgi:hypothetical protein
MTPGPTKKGTVPSKQKTPIHVQTSPSHNVQKSTPSYEQDDTEMRSRNMHTQLFPLEPYKPLARNSEEQQVVEEQPLGQKDEGTSKEKGNILKDPIPKEHTVPSEDKKQNKQVIVRKSTYKSRANMTEEKRNQIRLNDRTRQKNKRDAMTEEEKERIRVSNKKKRWNIVML